eukprot:709603-Pelagomonas_calceolata.AAC.2
MAQFIELGRGRRDNKSCLLLSGLCIAQISAPLVVYALQWLKRATAHASAQATLHTILLGVGGVIYTPHILEPL